MAPDGDAIDWQSLLSAIASICAPTVRTQSSGPDLGSWPAWAAFVTASVAVFFSVLAYMREGRRDRAREEQAFRAQASEVAVWLDGGDDTSPVQILNGSSLPIENVVILGWKVDDFTEVDPIRQWSKHREAADCHTLGKYVAAGPGFKDWKPAQGCELIAVEFRDAQGISWVRFKGKLFANSNDEQPKWYSTFNESFKESFTSMLSSAPQAAFELSHSLSLGLSRLFRWLTK